jgi:capsular polysaccharide biosynthesis protein
MELQKLLKFYKDKWLVFVIFGIIGAALGTGAFYYVPKLYTAQGSLFVSRGVAEDGFNSDFTYEGYYAKQSAAEYSNTIVALLESIEVKQTAGRETDFGTDSAALRKLNRMITVKRKAPQLIILEVKSRNEDTAKAIWNALAKTTVFASTSLNGSGGDPKLKVVTLSNQPVMTEAYRNVWLCGVIGLFLGSFFAVFVVGLFAYLNIQVNVSKFTNIIEVFTKFWKQYFSKNSN